jgi:hypothetical protein
VGARRREKGDPAARRASKATDLLYEARRPGRRTDKGMHAEAANAPSPKHRPPSSGGYLPIRVRLMGSFIVWVGSRAVGEGAWRLRKAKSLVKLLALSFDIYSINSDGSGLRRHTYNSEADML